jgi:exonuclease III
LEKKFFQRGYEIKHKSEKASHGVGILWKRGLGVNVVSQYSDSKDNFLFLKIELSGVQLLLGSIYGPNKNEIEFFDKINEILGKTRAFSPLLEEILTQHGTVGTRLKTLTY